MCKQRFLKVLIVGTAFCGFPGIPAWAHSVPMAPPLVVNSPSEVLMIDGKDRNSRVKIRVQLDAAEWCAYDFGFMDDGSYTSITGRAKPRGGYTFMGGSVVDFALRNYGADRLFGTPDDLIYRLSDGADYAREIFFRPVEPSLSKNPSLTQKYFRDLRLGWDLDLDGKSDVYSWLEIKRGEYDGMMPVPAAAPVPVPGAVWFFGSGLLGLALVARRAERRRHCDDFNIQA